LEGRSAYLFEAAGSKSIAFSAKFVTQRLWFGNSQFVLLGRGSCFLIEWILGTDLMGMVLRAFYRVEYTGIA
jgi:hypothetical protein